MQASDSRGCSTTSFGRRKTPAGLINALEITGRDMKSFRLVCNGAGAAAIASVELVKALGVPGKNAAEMPLFAEPIARLEAEITKLVQPTDITYELKPE